MARPMWNGTISFGLLNVPGQLHSGERSLDLHFRMLDARKAPRSEGAQSSQHAPQSGLVSAISSCDLP